MRRARMQFGEFVFPVNPSRVTVGDARRLAAQPLPYGAEIQELLGPRCRAVTAEGQFLGADAARQWRGLQQEAVKGPGALFVPGMAPMTAVLHTLTLEESPQPGTIGYTAEFRELATQPAAIQREARIVPAWEEDSLWSIAGRAGATVEELLSLNPGIPHPWAVTPGQEVLVPC